MKVLKNTTLSAIAIQSIGLRIPASGQLILESTDNLQLASDQALTELSALINSGDIVVNDGVDDLSAADGFEFIKYPNFASSIRFSTIGNSFQSKNVHSAIVEAKETALGFRFQYAQFQFIGKMDFDQYLFSNTHIINNNNGKRSGDASNGYQFSNSAPLTAAFTGKVFSAAASIRGIAQSTGSPAASLEMFFELWKVGFNNQGAKLGDIIFNVVSANYTIGNFWNSSIVTGFAENQPQDVSVSAGDLLGLKFIRRTGNDRVVSVENTTVVLEITGTAS